MLGGGPGGQSPPVLEAVDRNGTVGIVYARPGLGSGPDARWSPDGSLLAWTGPDGLYVANADGTGQRRLVRQSTTCRDACVRLDFAWSPDGRSLLVGGAGAQTNGLLLVPVGSGDIVEAAPTLDVRVTAVGSGVTRVAYVFPDWRYEGSFPTLSPDGRSIAFVHPSPSGDVIRVVTLRTGKAYDLAGLRPATSLAWSPNSKRLAYVTLSRPRFHVEAVAVRYAF